MQGIALIAAIGSGAGIALQNLIFGQFITTITDFTSGESKPSKFRQDVADLAWVSPSRHHSIHLLTLHKSVLCLSRHWSIRSLLHLERLPHLLLISYCTQHSKGVSSCCSSTGSCLLWLWQRRFHCYSGYFKRSLDPNWYCRKVGSFLPRCCSLPHCLHCFLRRSMETHSHLLVHCTSNYHCHDRGCYNGSCPRG